MMLTSTGNRMVLQNDGVPLADARLRPDGSTPSSPTGQARAAECEIRAGGLKAGHSRTRSEMTSTRARGTCHTCSIKIWLNGRSG
jgi:hypothetical protein